MTSLLNSIYKAGFTYIQVILYSLIFTYIQVRVAFLKTMPFRISVAFQTKAQDLALRSQFWACLSTLSFRQHFHWLLGISVRFHWCAYPKFSPVSLFPAFSFLGYSLVIFLCAPWNKRPSLISFVLYCVTRLHSLLLERQYGLQGVWCAFFL